MEIETREIPLKERDRYQTRLKSYHAELSKLEKDLVSLNVLLQRINIACYAERCISHSKSVRLSDRLSVRLSVCLSVTRWH